jgi:hypothetical protein
MGSFSDTEIACLLTMIIREIKVEIEVEVEISLGF